MERMWWGGRFLLKSWRYFSRISGNPHHESDGVQPEEELTRFIFTRKYFAAAKGLVKYAAFMPAQDGNTSVYRTSDLDNVQAWALARQESGSRVGSLKALATIQALAALREGLHVRPEPKPHPLHANLCNWPEPDDERLMIAVQLARAARLRLDGQD